jgi:hypothetical protein
MVNDLVTPLTQNSFPPDMSRQYRLFTFSQKEGVDGKIFEEKLFASTV